MRHACADGFDAARAGGFVVGGAGGASGARASGSGFAGGLWFAGGFFGRGGDRVSAAGAAALAEAWRILGGALDPMRVVWDEQATDKDRRLLLAMGGLTGPVHRFKSSAAWVDLRAEDRAAIAAGLRRFRAWSERLL